MSNIRTPETHPNDHVIGQHFKSSGVIWFCDSYDPALGYWMTPVFGEIHGLTEAPPIRRNVSVRAIGRTYHNIFPDKPPFGDVFFACRQSLTPEERAFCKARISVETA